MLKTKNNKLMLNDKAYAIGRRLVQVYIPATSSLYFGLSAIWGLPNPEQVVGTLACLATFIGVCLGISTRQYNKSDAAYDGQITVDMTAEGKKIYSLELDDDPEDLDLKKSVSFKIAK